MIKQLAAVFAMVLSVGVFATAATAACSALSDNLEEAEARLRRAARATDLDEGRSQARRAQRALEEASQSAEACNCSHVASDFDRAAYMASRAYTSIGSADFASGLKHAIQAYEAGTRALQTCRPR